MKMRNYLILLFLILGVSCQRVSERIDPVIERPMPLKERQRQNRDFAAALTESPFAPLRADELAEDWGKEYQMGFLLAQDFDLYRAIGSFKRALFFLGDSHPERALELHYFMALSYYLGQKYVEVIYIAECSALGMVDCTFAVYEDLIVLLYDSYRKIGKLEKAEHIRQRILAENIEAGKRLFLFSAVECADFETLSQLGSRSTQRLVSCYSQERKSPRKARLLNALVPGAGYWYLGQRSTAVTAFLVNALFIGATAEFFIHDNIAAGLICLSFESGWYFGGINGAGLCANYYNARLWENYGHKICQNEKLFPLVMVKFSF